MEKAEEKPFLEDHAHYSVHHCYYSRYFSMAVNSLDLLPLRRRESLYPPAGWVGDCFYKSLPHFQVSVMKDHVASAWVSPHSRSSDALSQNPVPKPQRKPCVLYQSVPRLSQPSSQPHLQMLACEWSSLSRWSWCPWDESPFPPCRLSSPLRPETLWSRNKLFPQLPVRITHPQNMWAY